MKALYETKVQNDLESSIIEALKQIENLQAENANLEERIFMKSILVDSLKAENAKLRECLSNWLSWEQKQINTHGEYCGEEIKKLISDARQVLKELDKGESK